MGKEVTLTIDGQRVSVPEGTLVVNAAKKLGIDIPVFCYHPKMEPVGMCRMCLVEIGRPVIDRATGQPALEADGSLKIQYGPKLETACTTPVSQGMVVLNNSQKARAGRKDILEFLLTSHPLDCPVCDKGGECPLQNLTMAFGPAQSRYLYDEKKHNDKHVPLGDLIFLDRERCIQCGRCVRFQDVVVDDPVLGFSQRGRSIEIVSYSQPGFDSYFSGNTTDICPVGALTTADFRFRARPWELKAAASICTQCPVGCNLTFNVRREAVSGGNMVIKRAMPRQNEQVNEIWLCDKGRFGYHYTRRENRLAPQPLVRKNGALTPSSWQEALELVAGRFKAAGKNLLTVASGRLSNEDLFNLRQLTQGLGGQVRLQSSMAGGDLVTKAGLAPGSDFAAMGSETAILVVASDLHEEAPIWWLRVKQAAGRGARLIVANPWATRLERYAAYSLRYPLGEEAAFVRSLSSDKNSPAAQALAEAQNVVVIFGSEGLGLEGSQALAEACAGLLAGGNHTGRPNNGLLGVWPRANDQGAWELGFAPAKDLPAALAGIQALYLVGVDLAGDDPALAQALQGSAGQERPFIVVQELALTETAKLADVVLPVLAYTEREGSFTSGERRVQRFFPAVPGAAGLQADFSLCALIAQRLGLELEGRSAASVFLRMANSLQAFGGLDYQVLAQVKEQWPIVSRGDLFYGGTSYENAQGVGASLPLLAQPAKLVAPTPQPRLPASEAEEGTLLAVPVTRLYDRGVTLAFSQLLRLPDPYVVLHPLEAQTRGLAAAEWVALDPGTGTAAEVRLDASLPQGVVLVPRSMGLGVSEPRRVQLRRAKPVDAGSILPGKG